MSDRKKRAYAYTRVSTAMQVEGYSLDAQKDKIKKYAELHDIDIVREFSDEGKSGTSIKGRDDFQRMIGYIEDGESVDYIIVYKLSRFGRKASDILNTFELMQGYGVNLISVEDGIDTSKGIGKTMIAILGAVAELERDNIAAQTMAGRIQKAKEGKWNGGQAPFGYSLNNGYLEANEDADTVRLIFDLYVNQNKGMRAIVKHLEDRGYERTLYKNLKYKGFTDKSIRDILDNPVYVGKMTYGRRKTEKINGKPQLVKQKEYETYDGQQIPLISEDLWEAAVSKRKKTGHTNDKRYSIGHAHKLSGILKCPLCGAGMYGNVNRKKKKDGSLYKDCFYYMCKHRKILDGQKCSFKRQPNQERVDAEVIEALHDALNNEKFIEEVKEKMNANADTDLLEAELQQLLKNERKTQTQIDMMHKRLEALDIDNTEYKVKYADITSEQDKKYEELSRIQEQIKTTEKKITMSIRAQAAFMDTSSIIWEIWTEWNNYTEQELKEFLHKYIEKVEIFPDFDKTSRIVKKITFRFPMYYYTEPEYGSEPLTDELIEWHGEMIPRIWGNKDNSEKGNIIEWDKEGRVETVVSLSHQIVDTVKVDYVPEKTEPVYPTYADIRQYIKDKYNMTVSTLNIAYVKNIHGLIKENQFPDNGKRPKTPDAKREVIEAAFRHYNLI